MRAVFYILVLLNVAFFGWARWIDTPATTYAAPSRAGGSLPTLALVDNRSVGATAGATAGTTAGATTRTAAGGADGASGAAPAAAGGTSANAALAGNGERCRSLGPFQDAASTARVAARLRVRGFLASERDVDISVNDGYTVYIDQFADAAAQSRALARLKRAGITDAHSGSGPDGKPRVSLGVFQDQPHAVRRAEQVRGLGFRPVLDIHQNTLTTRWLDLTLRTNQPEPALEQLLGAGAAAGASGGVSGQASGAGVPAVAFSDCPAKGG